MKLKPVVLLIALSLPLAGCGNKGPLVLPQKPVPVDESMPVEAPADTTDAPLADDPATQTGSADEPPAATDAPTEAPIEPPPGDGD